LHKDGRSSEDDPHRSHQFDQHPFDPHHYPSHHHPHAQRSAVQNHLPPRGLVGSLCLWMGLRSAVHNHLPPSGLVGSLCMLMAPRSAEQNHLPPSGLVGSLWILGHSEGYTVFSSEVAVECCRWIEDLLNRWLWWSVPYRPIGAPPCQPLPSCMGLHLFLRI
jgi:hypothetical protein